VDSLSLSYLNQTNQLTQALLDHLVHLVLMVFQEPMVLMAKQASPVPLDLQAHLDHLVELAVLALDHPVKLVNPVYQDRKVMLVNVVNLVQMVK